MKPPRKHHYIPQFYLAGFTKTGQPDGRFYVLDRRQKRRWVASPRDTAHIRDYHAIDLGPNVDPTIIEKKLAIFEGQQSAVLRSIINDPVLPRKDEETSAALMGFVAMMAVRVPSVRNRISEFLDDVYKMELFAAISMQHLRAAFRQFLEDGLDEMPIDQPQMAPKCIASDAELERTAKLAASSDFPLGFEQTRDVQVMLRNVPELIILLARRNWALWLAGEDAPNLICSDCPTCLNWFSNAGTLQSPGFEVPNTIVSIPLNHRMALVGTFEPLAERKTIVIGSEAVALINAWTLMHATQVYSTEEDFVWLKRDRSIGRGADFLANLE